MFKSFLVLNISMNASDEDIRKKYLELVKKFPPEREPEQFRKINDAYDEIKDQRSRIKSRLFSTFRNVELEKNLEELAGSVKFTPKPNGLAAILDAGDTLNGPRPIKN
ncbi:MAG: J domain-containing protein [Desulfamplus sp.]|nr:J domain-containing protein [Desulfamplus sp.]